MSRPAKMSYVLSSQIAFVPHPSEPGRWLRLHPCAVFADCEHCRAKRGEPCRGANGEFRTSATHVMRRMAARVKVKAAKTMSHFVYVEAGR